MRSEMEKGLSTEQELQQMKSNLTLASAENLRLAQYIDMKVHHQNKHIVEAL